MNDKTRAIAWVQGYIAAKIEGFSNSLGIPSELFTEGLRESIHAEGQRIQDSLPILQVHSTRLPEIVGGKMESDRSTHSGKARRKIGSKQKSYWAKKFPTKELRAKEVARRMRLSKRKAGK